MTQQGWMRSVGAAMAALALAACSSPSCTMIDCASELRVDLTDLARQTPASSLSVRLCVENDCTDQIVTPEAAAAVRATRDLPTAVASGKPQALRLSVRVTAGQRVLADAATTAEVERFAPNGGGACGPVCYVARVTLRGGQLVDDVGRSS